MINSKPMLEYDFFKLFLATIKLNDYNPVLKRNELQEKLFELYDLEEFKTLFYDVVKKETIDSKHIDLSDAFLYAYAYGMIYMIHDSSDEVKYLVNIDDKQALKALSQYTEEEKTSMIKLLDKLEEKEKNKVFKKEREN